MPDCFISYSKQDKRLAEAVKTEMEKLKIKVFMASASLQPGQNWSAEILNNLKRSNWVILLASRSACTSAFVNQEVGGALLTSKKLVPIVWDMDPSDLPGWAKEVQAVDLRNSTMVDLQRQVASIATQIRQGKQQGLFIVGAIILAVWALGNK